MDKYCLLTNDVEMTSIVNNNLNDETGRKVLLEGMPRLLEVYECYNIKSTFFYTGNIARKFPEVVKMIIAHGHEVACHGNSHEVSRGFDILSLEDQIHDLTEAKKILEDISGQEVISFRAPALRVNKHTPIALSETGFKIDSSVASQRLDMMFSFGSLKKMNWITSPRLPYYTHPGNLWKKGSGDIMEVPISAFAVPYIGTFMRVAPGVTRLLRSMLDKEQLINKKPVVFLIHPNELIDEVLLEKNFKRRSGNYVGYFLKDKIRRQIKLKNLGHKAVPFLTKQIEYFNKKNYQFITLKEYYARNQ